MPIIKKYSDLDNFDMEQYLNNLKYDDIVSYKFNMIN